MRARTKVYLLAAGTTVYGAGYLVLVAAVLLGEIGGLGGIAAVLMATGLLVALVIGVALARTEAALVGEL